MANHRPEAGEGQGEQGGEQGGPPQGSNAEIRSGSEGEVAMWAKRKVRGCTVIAAFYVTGVDRAAVTMMRWRRSASTPCI